LNRIKWFGQLDVVVTPSGTAIEYWKMVLSEALTRGRWIIAPFLAKVAAARYSGNTVLVMGLQFP